MTCLKPDLTVTPVTCDGLCLSVSARSFSGRYAYVVSSIKMGPMGHLAASGSVRGEGGSLPGGRWIAFSLAPHPRLLSQSKSRSRETRWRATFFACMRAAAKFRRQNSAGWSISINPGFSTVPFVPLVAALHVYHLVDVVPQIHRITVTHRHTSHTRATLSPEINQVSRIVYTRCTHTHTAHTALSTTAVLTAVLQM